jgi:hypothetical protein
VVGRREGEPPQGDNRETGEENEDAAGAAPKEEESPKHQDEVKHREWNAQTCDLKVKIKSGGCPCGQKKSNKYQESEQDLTQQMQVAGSFLVEND